MTIDRAKLKSVLSDIRTWILFFFLLRLIGIFNAPLEIGHNWRQSLTNMIARNFLEVNPNIFYPRIDMAGNQSGIIGSEFPFFNYLIYLWALIFDYSHWAGRLINLIVSSLGIFFFYRLLEKICNQKIAFSATLILLSSIWFAFSRKIMPDTFSVSLVITGLYFLYKFIDTGKNVNIGLYFLFICLGGLCKIPALSLLAPLPLLFISREISSQKKIKILTATGLGLIPVGIWYFYWVPYLVETWHYALYFPKGIAEGLKEISDYLPGFFEKFYFSALCSYVAFAATIPGIYFLIKSKNNYLKYGILLLTLTFLLFIIKTGSVFPQHNYYIIPFSPVMALLAAFGLAKLPDRYRYILIGLIAIEGIANQQHDFFIKPSEKYKLSLEEITHKIIPANEMVITNGGQSPQQMYFAHCKGWTLENDQLSKDTIQYLTSLGASWLIINKNRMDENNFQYPLKYSDDNFNIYKLN